MSRNGKIWLSKNIKLTKDYRSVLGYTESQMINLLTDSSNLVYYADDYSFIRDKGSIQVNCKYNVAVQSNYMAFQNPDYSSKVFFAFIDEVKYLSENSTEIVYTVDVWTTWWEYWSAKACFVVREHVIDDTVGANLLPENVELGEYIVNSHSDDTYNTDLTVVTGSTVGPSDYESYTMNVYNGLPSPVVYCRWDNLTDLKNFIDGLNSHGKIDALKTMFLCPKWLCPSTLGTVYVDESQSENYELLEYTPITLLDTYQPVNNKLLTYPYCYFGVSNGVGQYNILRPEFWKPNTNNKLIITLNGVLTTSCSIKAVPYQYKGHSDNIEESVTIGKFPPLAWSNDIYTNWQTQNGINILGIKLNAEETGYLKGGLQLLQGKTGAGISTISNSMQSNYQHSLQPNGVEGSLNSGDVNTVIGANRLHVYKMTISRTFASIIDKYFTRMGYAVNTVKVPNLGRRLNYNYVQIANDDNVAYPNNHNNICLPASALKEINDLFRNGITIWNNHTNFGDYSVSNTITNP